MLCLASQFILINIIIIIKNYISTEINFVYIVQTECNYCRDVCVGCVLTKRSVSVLIRLTQLINYLVY